MASNHYQIPDTPINLAEKDHYAMLDIDHNATNEEIVKAYRKQALKYHPDKTLDSKTEEWMKLLNEAKEVLLSEKRSDYDEQLFGEGHVPVHREPLGYLPEGMVISIVLGMDTFNNLYFFLRIATFKPLYSYL